MCVLNKDPKTENYLKKECFVLQCFNIGMLLKMKHFKNLKFHILMLLA